NPVWPAELTCQERELAIFPSVHPAEGQLLARIVEELWQTKGGIGDVQGAIRLVDQVVRAVEPLALVAVGEHGFTAIAFQPDHAAIAMLIDGETSLRIEREPVRSRLPILCAVGSGVTARSAEHAERTVAVAVNDVTIGIGEQQATAIRIEHPDRAFGELEALRELPQLRIRGHDCIDRGIQPQYVDVHLVRGKGNRSPHPWMELKLRIVQKDEVRG